MIYWVFILEQKISDKVVVKIHLQNITFIEGATEKLSSKHKGPHLLELES